MMERAGIVTALLVAAMALTTHAATAQPAGPPRVSPMATASQVVGVCQVGVTYSRPSARGREIFGGLVPYGQIWRTGANEATVLELSHDARIAGQEISAGSYALFTIPGEQEWSVIFNRVAEQWGAFRHDSEQDALRLQVKPRGAPFRETFSIDFVDVGVDTVTVQLSWAEVAIPFDVQFDVVAAAIEKARAFAASATVEESQMLWNWANYCYQNEVNSEEATEWATRVADSAPSYWTHALHARLLARTGSLEQAVAAAEAALARAPEEAERRGVTADSEVLAGELAAWRGEGAG